VARLERPKAAHLSDDVECVLGIGLRRMIAGHGDSQPVLRSPNCKRCTESSAVVEPLQFTPRIGLRPRSKVYWRIRIFRSD
jgi:hypothetical protein